MPDMEKVMLGLEVCSSSDINMDCPKCPYYMHTKQAVYCMDRLMRDALLLLKEQEPRVLKYNEIEGHPLVWLEDDDKEDVIPAIFLSYNRWNAEFIRQAPDECVSTVVRSATVYAVEKAYGIKWRCWTHMPTKEQRKAVSWDDPENDKEDG